MQNISSELFDRRTLVRFAPSNKLITTVKCKRNGKLKAHILDISERGLCIQLTYNPNVEINDYVYLKLESPFQGNGTTPKYSRFIVTWISSSEENTVIGLTAKHGCSYLSKLFRDSFSNNHSQKEERRKYNDSSAKEKRTSDKLYFDFSGPEFKNVPTYKRSGEERRQQILSSTLQQVKWGPRTSARRKKNPSIGPSRNFILHSLSSELI